MDPVLRHFGQWWAVVLFGLPRFNKPAPAPTGS